ncbi:extracellular solute-binding protein [Nereida sp. NH-UV-3]|uniref:extracellular solute-binding protein n=1 Tax=Nereida TaxID=282198 RepID=UPI0036F23800
MWTKCAGLIFALVLSVAVMPMGAKAEQFIVVQSTTSTQNSGLFDTILPVFEAATGIEVRVVAVGTGQALRNAQNGDGDVLLVHAKAAEQAFVDAGYGLPRHDVMYNDFVLIGPKDDPAGIRGTRSAAKALARIAAQKAPFASRGDDSGTHKAEMRMWGALDPTDASGTWYRETGSGMGATLNTGIAMGAYVLSDRATWLAFGNKADHDVLVEGDPAMFNQYGVIVVDPARHPHVKVAEAQRFADWLTQDEGQSAIAAFTVAGTQLFYPNATPR